MTILVLSLPPKVLAADASRGWLSRPSWGLGGRVEIRDGTAVAVGEAEVTSSTRWRASMQSLSLYSLNGSCMKVELSTVLGNKTPKAYQVIANGAGE